LSVAKISNVFLIHKTHSLSVCDLLTVPLHNSDVIMFLVLWRNFHVKCFFTREICRAQILSFFHVPGLTHRFWLRIFPFTYNHDTLNLTTDIWNGAHGGCDRSAEDAYSFATPDPTFAFVGGLFCRTLDFVIAFWIMIAFYTLLTSLFCI
jgi:hypothetical protein